MKTNSEIKAKRLYLKGISDTLKNTKASGEIRTINEAQISIFTENYLRETETRGNDDLSLWDVYNLGTHIYKPATTEIPNIIPQTAVLFDVLNDTFKITQP